MFRGSNNPWEQVFSEFGDFEYFGAGARGAGARMFQVKRMRYSYSASRTTPGAKFSANSAHGEKSRSGTGLISDDWGSKG